MSTQQTFSPPWLGASDQQTFTPLLGGSLFISGNSTINGSLRVGSFTSSGSSALGNLSTPSTTSILGNINLNSSGTSATTINIGTSANFSGTVQLGGNNASLVVGAQALTPVTPGGATLGSSAVPWGLFYQGTGGTSNEAFGFASVTLNTASVQGMYNSPVQIVASQGSGASLFVKWARLVYEYDGSTAFVLGGPLILQYGAAAHGAGQNACNNTQAGSFLTATVSQWVQFNGLNASVVANTVSDNAALYLTNQTNPFTSGGTSQVVVQVAYTVKSTAP